MSLFHDRLHDMQSYFQLDENIVHLNHAAVAPWPVVTRDAVIAFARENAAIGSQNYSQWMATESQLKQRLAQLINAQSTDEIAILKNTSEGLSLIAQGLDFNAGDNIVIPAEEFPSNKIVWQALRAQGVETRLIPVQDVEDPEQALIDAMDERTRLLSCSSVQFARGLRLDLNRIGEACRQNDCFFFVSTPSSHSVPSSLMHRPVMQTLLWLMAINGCALLKAPHCFIVVMKYRRACSFVSMAGICLKTRLIFLINPLRS